LEAIAGGDTKAKAIFDEMIDNLSFGLSHVVHLLNPEIIVIGGGLSLIGEYISNSVSQKLPQYLMSSLKNSLPEIEIARLKEDVVPLGAVLLSNKDLV
jgi:glucokinase